MAVGIDMFAACRTLDVSATVFKRDHVDKACVHMYNQINMYRDAVIEVYQSWCGPCKAVASILKKLYFDMSDKPLKFYTVRLARCRSAAINGVASSTAFNSCRCRCHDIACVFSRLLVMLETSPPCHQCHLYASHMASAQDVATCSLPLACHPPLAWPAGGRQLMRRPAEVPGQLQARVPHHEGEPRHGALLRVCTCLERRNAVIGLAGLITAMRSQP